MSETLVGQAETWRYGGLRLGRSGKLLHCWHDGQKPGGLLFARKGASSFAIGALYRFDVTRTPEGVTIHGVPEYAGRGPEDEAVAQWELEDKAAQAEKARKSLEANARKMSAVDHALEPLLAVAANTTTWTQQQALLDHVSRELNRAFMGRRRG